MLKTRLIPAAAGAYQYPLLIKSLMLSGRRYEKSHEIVYRDQCHFQKTTARNIRSRLHWWIAARCTGPSCSP